MTQLTCTVCRDAIYTAAPVYYEMSICPHCMDGVYITEGENKMKTQMETASAKAWKAWDAAMKAVAAKEKARIAAWKKARKADAAAESAKAASVAAWKAANTARAASEEAWKAWMTTLD